MECRKQSPQKTLCNHIDTQFLLSLRIVHGWPISATPVSGESIQRPIVWLALDPWLCIRRRATHRPPSRRAQIVAADAQRLAAKEYLPLPSIDPIAMPAVVKPLISKLRSISIPHGSIPGMPATLRARTAVVGTIANLTAGVLLGIVQAKMKEEMLESLKKMPKPQIDRRNAASFFADPNTAKSIRLIELMSKNMMPFSMELDEHHVKTVTGSQLEIALLAISSLPVKERLDFLVGLQNQLNVYADQLNIVLDNLESANDLLAKAIESAQGAEELANAVDRALIADSLLKQGFDFNEIVDIHRHLQGYAFRVRQVFQDVNALRDQVRKLLREQGELSSQVNKLYWNIGLSSYRKELKKRE